ncbi:MAG: hypothetical protein KY054_01325 [Candidatus Nealsonbacteria bacterium]|nr:hypothetical protein [Candidatus Nealsonbacteria bacterium]
MAFYPIGLRVLSILAIAEVFDFNENQVRNEIGENAPKMSFVVKVFAQSFGHVIIHAVILYHLSLTKKKIF